MKQKDGLFQRKKGGVWYAIVKRTVDSRAGDRKREKVRRYCESTGFTSKADARVFLEAMRLQVEKGTYKTPKERRAMTSKGETVGALADRWLSVYVAVNRTPKDRATAKYRVETYLKAAIGALPGVAVTKDTLRLYRGYLEGLKEKDAEGKETETARLHVQTVRHILADARCLFAWAHDSGYLDRLPIPKKLLPKVPERLPRRLSAEEEKAISDLSDPHGLACRIMLGTGVRWGELSRLTSADVVSGELAVQGETKSRKLRLIPIPAALLAELKGHVGKLVPFETKDNPTFNRSVQRATGIEDFGAHRCRHSYAANYLAQGGSIRALQVNLGHASLETTEIYLRGGQDLVRSDAKRIMGWSATA